MAKVIRVRPRVGLSGGKRSGSVWDSQGTVYGKFKMNVWWGWSLAYN